MAENIDTLKKIFIRFFIGLSLVVSLYWLSIPTLYSETAFVSYHALLGFLATASAALAFLVNYRNPSTSRYILFIALLYRVVIHIGIAVFYSFNTPNLSISFAPFRAFMDMQSFLVFSLLILLAAFLEFKNIAYKMTSIIGLVLLLSSLMIYSITFFISFSLLPLDTIVSSIPLSGIISMGALFTAIYFYNKDNDNRRIFDKFYLIAGLFSLSLAPIATTGFIFGFYTMWIMSIFQQALGLGFMYLAIGEPLFRRSRIGKRGTEAILGFLLAISIIPFTIGILSEAYVPGVMLADIGAYLISHGTAALLSGMMSVLLIVYNRKKPSWDLLPLIVLYLSWTFIEIFIVIGYQVYIQPGLGESLVPYIMGGFVSLLVLYRGIVIKTHPPPDNPTEIQVQWIGRRIALVGVGVILFWYVENRILALNPSLVGSPVGRAVLLLTNVLALFGFSILLYITARKYRNWKSIEGLALIFLAFWIVPGILKGVFLDWTVGWWLGELLLILGVGIGPPLLATLYIDSMSEAQDAQRRAMLYSDLLAHDITNMHQAILVALSLIELDETDEESRNLAIDDARKSLGRAADIVENVRQIGIADQIGEEELVAIDLVAKIMDAFSQVQLEFPKDDIAFRINSSEGHCFVSANNLLLDIFYNLFKNAIIYSENEKRIDVIIQHDSKNGTDFWRILVEDHGRGIEDERKIDLFKRYMKGAEGLGLGLSVVLALVKSFGGFIEVANRVPEDYSKGTTFIVLLPISSN